MKDEAKDYVTTKKEAFERELEEIKVKVVAKSEEIKNKVVDAYEYVMDQAHELTPPTFGTARQRPPAPQQQLYSAI